MKKIAVIAPARPHFGNTLTQLPFLVALRKAYGDCEITVWSKFESSRILVVNQGANRVVNYQDMSVFSFLRAFNREHYDIVFNLRSGCDKAHILIGLLSNAKKKYAYSIKKYNRYLYDQHLLLPKGQIYIANVYLRLLERVTKQRYDVSIIQDVTGHISCCKDTLVLLPGGGAGEFKRWPVERFVEVMNLVTHTPAHGLKHVVVILGRDEQAYHSYFFHSVNHVPVEVVDSPGVEHLIEIAQSTKLAIANDCGPAHIFQMNRCPIIMIWGYKKADHPPFHQMPEWSLPTANSWNIVPDDEHQSIQSISAQRVASLAVAQLNHLNGSVS